MPRGVLRGQWRYVEVSFDEPGEDTMFRAHVVWAESPAEAFELGKASTLAAHPYASNIELYLHNVLTLEQADKIKAGFRDRSWQGWHERGTA